MFNQGVHVDPDDIQDKYFLSFFENQLNEILV